MEQPLTLMRQAENHGGLVKAGGRSRRCYTRRQLRAFHPGGYELVGELRFAELTDDAPADEARVAAPGTHARWRYARRGYWGCGGNRYVALLEPALPRRILLLVCLCVLIAGGTLAAVYIPKMTAGLPAAGDPAAPLDPNAQDYAGEKTASGKGNPDAANTQIPGYKSVGVDAKSGELSIAPHNPEGNPCYFAISLLVDGEEIYKSGMIAPGQALYRVKADPIPPAGTHTATIKYDCFHLTTQAPLNGAEIQVELVVT